MDGAHSRLVMLEAKAYRCLSREEAQRILREADQLKGSLSSSGTPGSACHTSHVA